MVTLISVPNTAADLFNTGKIMKHCVGSYVSGVIDGSQNIINLMSGSSIAYTIELRFSPKGGIDVCQFKGYRNSREMEGTPKGDKYREALCRLILDHPNFRSTVSP